jgi:SAM-dependent methyltransferase
MTTPPPDAAFTGAIPALYEQLLVPLLFAPYAEDLAARAAACRPTRVLELAAGTGALTRALARQLPAGARLVATDLNPPMLAQAQALGTARPVQWQVADAQRLPFDDGAFDLVVCQFGVMFFPDKAGAYAEARRVLQRGGTLLFNTWDALPPNELAHAVGEALLPLYPQPPAPQDFLARGPHGYFDLDRVADDLARGGWQLLPQAATLALRSRTTDALTAARAYCLGTPLRNEIEARATHGLDMVTAAAAQRIAQRFGTGAIDAGMQAHVVEVERD